MTNFEFDNNLHLADINYNAICDANIMTSIGYYNNHLNDSTNNNDTEETKILTYLCREASGAEIGDYGAISKPFPCSKEQKEEEDRKNQIFKEGFHKFFMYSVPTIATLIIYSSMNYETHQPDLIHGTPAPAG